MLRLGRSPTLARLEVRDPDLAEEIDERATSVDQSGGIERRSRRRIIAWTLGATLALLLAGLVAVPAIADRLAPLVPFSLEHRLGEAVDAQARSMLDNRPSKKPFECGGEAPEQAGRTAFQGMIGRLEQAANLPIPIHIVVVRRPEANAIALPGGHIYVFEGLIDKAESGDELASVIAHEIGHVAHRDGTRAVLQGAGLSFLFGMVLGDFVGGGAVVIAAKTVLQSSYTREVEMAADMYSVELMHKTGGDPRALGPMLTRISGAIEPGTRIFQDHPDTRARVAAINAAANALSQVSQDGANTPTQNDGSKGRLLNAEEWAAVKRICTAE
jgi:Zn-dependent protease with chaperone function